MKIVNAIWEKRNLGVDVVEITCSEQDTIDELVATIDRINVPYSIIKIPTGCVPLLLAAQNYGYLVIENTFHYESSLKNIQTPRIYERFVSKVSVQPADECLINQALDEIKNGVIFTTDRIAEDPAFSKGIAGIRYYNWCVDVLNGDGIMKVAYYKDEPVAFNISQKDSGRTDVVYGVIGGMFANSLNKGLGFLLVQCEMECCKTLGGKICAGATSSNNIQSLRLHMKYGFDIVSSSYVLIKHK